MANYARYITVIIIVVIVGVVRGQTFKSLEDTDGNILKLNVLYDKRLVSIVYLSERVRF